MRHALKSNVGVLGHPLFAFRVDIVHVLILPEASRGRLIMHSFKCWWNRGRSAGKETELPHMFYVCTVHR